MNNQECVDLLKNHMKRSMRQDEYEAVEHAIQALTQGEAVVSADSIERLAKHLCSKKYPNQDIEFQGGNEFRLWEYHIIEAHEYLTAALQKQLR